MFGHYHSAVCAQSVLSIKCFFCCDFSRRLRSAVSLYRAYLHYEPFQV